MLFNVCSAFLHEARIKCKHANKHSNNRQLARKLLRKTLGSEQAAHAAADHHAYDRLLRELARLAGPALGGMVLLPADSIARGAGSADAAGLAPPDYMSRQLMSRVLQQLQSAAAKRPFTWRSYCASRLAERPLALRFLARAAGWLTPVGGTTDDGSSLQASKLLSLAYSSLVGLQQPGGREAAPAALARPASSSAAEEIPDPAWLLEPARELEVRGPSVWFSALLAQVSRGQMLQRNACPFPPSVLPSM